MKQAYRHCYYMEKGIPSLNFCVIMDLTGFLSYSLPVAGELLDIVWAPVASIIFFITFGRKKFGIQGAVFSFIEEIFPGLDFIPTFTIAWFIKNRIVQQGKMAHA